MLPIEIENDVRARALMGWLEKTAAHPIDKIVPLCGDASFRRYFRVQSMQRSYIVMDAPPQKESCHAFVAIARGLRAAGLNTPEIYAQDLQQGFLLLTDFGDKLLLSLLQEETVDYYYQRAFEQLLLMQQCSDIPDYALKPYESGLSSYMDELHLFDQWFLSQHLGWHLTGTETKALTQLYQLLADDIKSQPQVFVHRDFHSRNLMVYGAEQAFGILDFQDAVRGSVTYDLSSLLRDCYIDWPVVKIEQWVREYQLQALQQGVLDEVSKERFMRWFDWTGLQRNLKNIGLFVRLKLRDNKPGYMPDIPRILSYARHVASKYPELNVLHELLVRIDSQETKL